ncbi:MAG: hypothetical protein L0229_03510 [Blastocatellia bacterium]|nr:hypothetical protein [Blastocatellia bacterium]
MSKAIFVGLGGAGVYPTGYLKAKLLFDQYKGDINLLGQNCRFLFIDTDNDAINRLNDEYSKRLGDGRKFISGEERVDLGDINPYAVYWNVQNPTGTLTDEDKRLLSWVDAKGAKQFKNEPLRKGASANRQQGRVAIGSRWGDIDSKLRGAMNVLQNIQNQEQYDAAYPQFYILSGTCGGTGSSAFLDVAFRLDRLFRERYPTFGDPILRGVIFLPYQYLEIYKTKQAASVTIEDYESNAYAFFEEIEAVLADRWIADDGTKFSEVAVREIRSDKAFPVFNFAFCIDNQTERGFTMDQNQIYRNSAELLYYWHLGAAKDSVISQVDNERGIFPNTRKGDAVPAFYTIGYRALRFPEELMDRYFNSRFLYELFNHGILGERYELALPDVPRRDQHVAIAFKKNIARYLFAEDQEEGVPNVENDRRMKLFEQMTSFTIYRFRKEGKDEIDPDKVGDLDRLFQFEQDADSLAEQLIRDMDRDFRESGPTSLDSIVRFMRDGYQESTGKSGSLEDEIEDAIMRYGLQYAQEFVRRLDVMCDERVESPGVHNDIRDRVEDTRRRLQELEAEIASARNQCQEARKRDKDDSVDNLFAKLREKIERRAEVAIFNQQIEALNKLSRGEQGILDDYRKGIAQIAEEVRLFLDDKEKGLAEQYRSLLPKRFLDTEQDVTTTYLPDIGSFVKGGRWASNHLFAQLYEQVVEQSEIPGVGKVPVRQGADFGYAPDKRGLHRILWEMLTEPAYVGLSQGYEAGGHTVFFRKGFGTNPPEWPSQRVLSLLMGCATAYMQTNVESREEIKRERTRKLIERFNDLPGDEKVRVRNQFDEVGTQTFCPMELGEGTVYSVFAGSDRALAEELGFEKADPKSQFVEDSTKNRLVRIKVITRQTLRRYPHYRNLAAAYQDIKEGRNLARSVFAPHIHRLFNQVGAERGLALAALDSPEQRARLFVMLLFYRELCQRAFEAERPLLEQLVDLNEAFIGEGKRHPSPFIVTSDGGPRTVKVCSRIERLPDGRVQFLERNFLICNNPSNFLPIFNDLSQYGAQVFAAIAELDQHFKERCSRRWLSMLDESKAALKNKILQGAQVNDPAVRSFYEKLNNELEHAYQKMHAQVSSNSEGAAADSPKSAASGQDVVLDV